MKPRIPASRIGDAALALGAVLLAFALGAAAGTQGLGTGIVLVTLVPIAGALLGVGVLLGGLAWVADPAASRGLNWVLGAATVVAAAIGLVTVIITVGRGY